MRRTAGIIFKILPFALIAALVAAVLISGKELTIDTILSFMPDSIVLSSLVLILIYILKSLSVVFPLIVLQVAAGIIFPWWLALILNTIGTAAAYTVPYYIGRICGASSAEHLMQKYPKLHSIVAMQRKSDWFPSFILRSVSCLPGDIVSMYLGTISVPFIPYVTASVLGTLPGLIPATIAGTSLTNPRSLAFIISVIATIVTSLASILLYKFSQSKNAGTSAGNSFHLFLLPLRRRK